MSIEDIPEGSLLGACSPLWQSLGGSGVFKRKGTEEGDEVTQAPLWDRSNEVLTGAECSLQEQNAIQRAR